MFDFHVRVVVVVVRLLGSVVSAKQIGRCGVRGVERCRFSSLKSLMQAGTPRPLRLLLKLFREAAMIVSSPLKRRGLPTLQCDMYKECTVRVHVHIYLPV